MPLNSRGQRLTSHKKSKTAAEKKAALKIVQAKRNKKRPTLEQALKSRGIKSIANSKAKPKKKAVAKKTRNSSPLSNPKKNRLEREARAMKGKKR